MQISIICVLDQRFLGSRRLGARSPFGRKVGQSDQRRHPQLRLVPPSLREDQIDTLPKRVDFLAIFRHVSQCKRLPRNAIAWSRSRSHFDFQEHGDTGRRISPSITTSSQVGVARQGKARQGKASRAKIPHFIPSVNSLQICRADDLANDVGNLHGKVGRNCVANLGILRGPASQEYI